MNNDNLKRMILYIFASTGAVLFFLAFFFIFKENKYISAVSIMEIIAFFFIFKENKYISAVSIMEIIAANLVITIGLFQTNKIEFRLAIFEYLLDIVFMMAVIVVSGIIFKWYSQIPVWVTIIIVIVIYIIFNLLDIIRVHRDIKEINKLLQKLKEKETNIVL